jgi:predicted GIY-YIG superfamily endonuclease
MQAETYFVYMLKCADGSLYTGIAKNLDKRLDTHRRGNGARYVKARLPFELVYFETASSRSGALKREFQIKKLTRSQKIAMLAAMHGASDLPGLI